MRRLLSLTVMAGVVLAGMFSVAAPARAAIVDGGVLTDGVPLTVSVPTPVDDKVAMSFTASAGEHLTFEVTAASWTYNGSPSTASFNLSSPGASVFFACTAAGPTYCEVVIPATGTWTALLDPAYTAVGFETIVLGRDTGNTSLTPGQSTTATNTLRGQNAGYTFGGAAGQHVTFDFSAASYNDNGAAGYAYVYAIAPSGTALGPCGVGGSTYCEFTLNAAGTWRLKVDPRYAAIGSATFVYAPDQGPTALNPGDTVITTIALRGQNASYTFSGTSGTQAVFTITSGSWTGGGYLSFYAPGASSSVASCLPTPRVCRINLNATGTWRAVLDPAVATTGSVTFTYSL